MVKPAKPVAEMTDKERRQFAKDYAAVLKKAHAAAVKAQQSQQ